MRILDVVSSEESRIEITRILKVKKFGYPDYGDLSLSCDSSTDEKPMIMRAVKKVVTGSRMKI